MMMLVLFFAHNTVGEQWNIGEKRPSPRNTSCMCKQKYFFVVLVFLKHENEYVIKKHMLLPGETENWSLHSSLVRCPNHLHRAVREGKRAWK